jgi:tetratricopeptide (TPR) repeat protein
MEQEFNKAIEKFQAGQYKQAEKILLKLNKRQPGIPDVAHMLAYIAMETDRPEVAADYLLKLVESVTNDAGLFNLLGCARRKEGKLGDAIEAFSKAVSMAPELADARFNLATALFKDGRLEDAQAEFRRTVELAPDDANVHNGLGRVLHDLKSFDQARVHLEKAVSLRPGYTQALNTLGLVLVNRGDPDAALEKFTAALESTPDDAESHYNIGAVLAGSGRLEDAIENYHRATALQPDFAEAHNNLGAALQDLGKLDEAVASYHKALSLQPEFAEAHNNLGLTFQEMGGLQEAVASFQKAITIKPEFAEAHNNLGNAFQDLGKLDEAVASFHKALALKPGFAEAKYSLATIYKGLGQEDKAIAYFKEAGIRDSEEEVLRCLYKSGKFEEFNENIPALSKNKPASALISSLSAHASLNLKQPDNYNFCPKPLEFSYQNRFECLFENDEKLLQGLLRDIRSDKKDSRIQPIINFGEQSSGNLFNYPEPSFACLPDLIFAEMERYRAHFAGKECLLIRQWPQKAILKGWHVRMQSGGHLNAHIHELGWVSGTIYLSLPENVSNDEGRIELGFHGNNYPQMHEDFPTKILPIKTGDIILFPASVFHRTIPFNSDEERICIAFDLIPDLT